MTATFYPVIEHAPQWRAVAPNNFRFARHLPRIAGKHSKITDDISDARVYGGIHFRTDQVAGERLGKAVGKAVYKNTLRRMHDDD